jgi:hypothetical protein
MSKRVVPGRSERRCRICRSGKRELFEAAYEDYLNKVVCRTTGDKLTWPKLAERASVLSGEEVSVRATRRHAETHARSVGEARAAELDDQAEAGAAERDALIAEIDGLLESGETVSPSGLLALQMRSYLHSLREKLAAGESVTLTHDQAQRAATAMFSNAKRAEEASLLHALTGGIQASVRLQLGSVDAEPVGELEAGEVVGEVLAEEGEEPLGL